ncbi:hypothetical protein HRbin28_00297 [bacterium HR28]|nr:hypothetical protein HRbin28_00297 [bacterium HR28]
MARLSTVTVSIGHVEVAKILLPALELLLVRAHELIDDGIEEPPYARWVRDTGYALVASLRQQLRDVPWGERPLKMTLDADGLGLLAAALGALRRQAQDRTDHPPNTALEETRQRLWLSVPLDMEMAWWLGAELVSNELVPLVRMIRIHAESPGDDDYAERLLQAASAALQTQHTDAVRFVASLGELAWLARWTARSTAAPRLQTILDQVIDPLIRERQAAQEREAAQQRTRANPTSERAKDTGASARYTTSDQRENATSRHGSTGGAESLGAPAPVLRRLLAALIDLFVFGTLSSGIAAVGNVLFVGDATGFIYLPADMYDRLYGFLSSVVPLVAGYFYWIYPVGRWGSTLGKRAVSLKVVNTQGAAPGQAKALGRVLIAALLGWLLFLPWWPIPFRLDRRGLHDLAADVWVIVDPLA